MPVTNQHNAVPITIRSITKTYGDVYALDEVDLDVKSGEFLTLLGPSGSGKTTLLMVLAGFTRPDHGSVLFGESEVIRMPPHKREVGMVFQNYALFPHMTVAGNIGFPLRLRGVNKNAALERVENALGTVQLGGYGDRRIDQLSGGQMQRVALARAIVFEPRILLYKRQVYVTHDQREALTMSDRVAVINDGKLMQLDSPRQIYDQPASTFVANFIGESTLLPVDHRNGQISYAGNPVDISGSESKNGRFLMLRPERLILLSSNNDSTYNTFQGKVKDIVYQGESFLLYVTLIDGTDVAVRSVSQKDLMAAVPEVGSEIVLGLHPDETVLIPDDNE